MHVLGKLLRLGGGATGISALLLLCSVPSAPGAAPTVSIQPEGHIVDPGDPFVASLMVNAEAGTISTFDAVFRFNPEVVVLDSASQGSLYVNCDPGFFTWFGFEEESLGTW